MAICENIYSNIYKNVLYHIHIIYKYTYIYMYIYFSSSPFLSLYFIHFYGREIINFIGAFLSYYKYSWDLRKPINTKRKTIIVELQTENSSISDNLF